MDIIEFTRRVTGMEDEYQKVLQRELYLFKANGHDKQSLTNSYDELRRRKQRYFDSIQHMMTEISLEERALAEISTNKEYWSEE